MPRVRFGEPFDGITNKTEEPDLIWWHIPIGIEAPKWYQVRSIPNARVKMILDGKWEYDLLWSTNSGPQEKIDLEADIRPSNVPIIARTTEEGRFLSADPVRLPHFKMTGRRATITDVQAIIHRKPTMLTNDGTSSVHTVELVVADKLSHVYWLYVPKDDDATNDRFLLLMRDLNYRPVSF